MLSTSPKRDTTSPKCRLAKYATGKSSKRRNTLAFHWILSEVAKNIPAHVCTCDTNCCTTISSPKPKASVSSKSRPADTITSTDFFKSFSTKYAKLFDGLRCDSGDPFEFTERALSYYERHRIDPKKKTVVYSDGLDLEAIARIKGHVAGRLHDVYGVGTFLTNDVGVQPLNIVIKLFEVKPKGETDFLPVVKLSDSPGKHTGDPDEIDLCKRMLKL